MHGKWLLRISAAAVAMMIFAAPQAWADKVPTRPIKVILATGAGGSHDMHCRAVASVIHETLGQPFLCMVRGGGKIGMGALKRSKPDGYTIASVRAPTSPSRLMRETWGSTPRRTSFPSSR